MNKGEVLAEIETDKATVEVESGLSGVVARQLVKPGRCCPGMVRRSRSSPRRGRRLKQLRKRNQKRKPEDAPAANKTGDDNPPTISGGKQAAAETPGQAAQAPAATAD